MQGRGPRSLDVFLRENMWRGARSSVRDECICVTDYERAEKSSPREILGSYIGL